MPGYISEYMYFGDSNVEFIEITVPEGTDVSSYTAVIYNEDGTVHATFGLGTLQGTIAGNDVYLIDDNTPGWLAADTGSRGTLADNGGIALVDDTSTVLQFVSHDGPTFTATEGPANGMTSIDAGTTEPGESLQSDDDGSTYYIQSSPNQGTIPCYAPGTLIGTPDGPRAVETLQAGDLVKTLDHGPQHIRWVNSGDHPLKDVELDARPVLIAAGALGSGRPTHDLIVSPQHRVFVGRGGQLHGWFKDECFAPAKSLTKLPGIRHMKGKTHITWIHFACDRHEVVFANGCLSESLLLGPMILNGLTRWQRRELAAMYSSALTPDTALNGPPARECLKVGEVRRRLAKCIKERGQRTAKETRTWDRDHSMRIQEAERRV